MPPETYYDMLSFKPPHQPGNDTLQGKMRIFLGGSIENGKARDWQTELTDFLQGYNVAIFNPRRDDWDATLQQSIENATFRQQVQWEINNILSAHLVIFYIQSGTYSPITLYELGLVTLEAHKKNKQVIVCCEKGFWREGNVDVVCDMFGINSVKTMEGLKQEILNQIASFTIV